MTMESLITEEARSLIGAEDEPVTGYPVSEHEIRRFAYAVGDLNPLWLDPEYARNTGHGGIIAPPLFYSIPFPSDLPASELREDGVPKETSRKLSPPLRSTRTMGGGTDIEFFQPIRPGDVLTMKSRLADIYEKTGRSGLLCFVVRETTYTNQRGEVVCEIRSTGIIR